MRHGTGELDPGQVDLILRHLPGEITFVDERDVIVYYSDVKERIFSRSPELIGRKIQSCHEGKSLGQLKALLREFREGARDSAESAKDVSGRTALITYVAVRDGTGAYRGVVEVARWKDRDEKGAGLSQE